MYSTLHGAFGTWPKESTRSFITETTDGTVRSSGVNETFNFESENPPDPVRPVFSLNPNSNLNEKVFIPPFFVPPGVSRNGAVHTPSIEPGTGATAFGMARGESTLEAYHSNSTATQASTGSSSTVQEQQTIQERNSLDGVQASQLQESNMDSRAASPPRSPELEEERAELWSPEARKAFHEMVTAPGYINRYRLHMKKRERMMQFLQNPDKEPMLCDGSRDHQTKYQAAHWAVLNGKLYRKPESGRVGRFRRHLDDFEAWDVLTAEHIRSGHLGRDKLRKVLEQKYIGYTLQEIMFVLKECKKCSGRGPNAERKDSEEDIQMLDALGLENIGPQRQALPVSAPQVPMANVSKGPYGRQQSSNFMWF